MTELRDQWTARQAVALLLLVTKAESVVIYSGDREPGDTCAMSEPEIADALAPMRWLEQDYWRLRKYAQHLPGCVQSTTLSGDSACTCGFTRDRFEVVPDEYR